MEYYASVETGGTKCVCAVGTREGTIIDAATFPTTTPDETLGNIVQYFKPNITKYNISKMGVSSFGPIDLDKTSPTFGYITSTPKLQWQNTDVVGTIRRAYPIDVAFDTDVNSAALAEGAWGPAQGLHTYVYITVGTGIGIGIVVNNDPLHGMLHPEGGHMVIPLHPDDPSEGFCPFHKNCLEGLASGPTFDARWNVSAQNLPDEHLGWELEAHYLAVGCINLVYMVSPQKIIIGGGISKRTSMFPHIRRKVQHMLNNYILTEEVRDNIDSYIVVPALEHSGLMGGLLMASRL